jgi:hypothetical protein
VASDARFAVNNVSQAIALSSGRDDTGMFELNLRDERYLPFEGMGAISQWQLELPLDTNRFDLDTLSDVVMHVRYTARDSGLPAFKDAVRTAVIAVPPSRTHFQLLSARTEFPDAFARLLAPTGSGQRLQLDLGPQHFPFIPTTQMINLTGVSAIMLFTADQTYTDYKAVTGTARLKARLGFTPGDGTPPTASTTFTAVDTILGGLPIAAATPTGPVAPLTLAFLEADLGVETTLLVESQTQPDSTTLHRLIRDKIDDVLILVTYQIAAKT